MKRYLLSMAAVAAVLFMGTSCSDKNSPENPSGPETIVGNYSGLLDVTLGGQPIVEDVEKEISIALAEGSSDKIDLTVADLTLNIMGTDLSLGTITISNCDVTGITVSYSFSSSEDQTITLPDNLGSCTVSTTGTVNGKNISATLNINWNNIPIIVSFEGTLVASAE